MNRLREIFGPHKTPIRRTLLIGAAFVLGFSVLALISMQGWEITNSVAFCSNTCHDVHPEEPAAFQVSYHARVKCTECHMGRVSTLEAIILKTSHARHLPEVLFDNYDRPLESATMRPANESCERCHWPPAFHGDTVRELVRFEPDEENSQRSTYVILKTGGGERERGLGYGIHWHIENQVEFIATGEGKQEIPWIRTTLPDGRTVEYYDAANPISAEEIAEAEVKVMDCVDCHNRVGHPFPYPDQAIDDALAEGRLDAGLPYLKKEISALLNAAYSNQEAALVAIEESEVRYAAAYPDLATSKAPAIQQAAEVARELVPRLVFEEPGVTWESFPDNGRHKEFPGCFRCHDGKHLSPEGESIRLHCNICHSIPVTVGPGDRPPQMPVASIQEPEGHLKANFMADHRFQADDDCAECHGEIRFGADDSSFCANSACHGQEWPSVELDAAFPHPIQLEGKHTEVWCHDCHEGEAKPDYLCTNCHQPPTAPHFGKVCEDCHTPAGFKPADIDGLQHPFLLEDSHAAIDCMACHSAGLDLPITCAGCHQPPNRHFDESCDACHTPEGWADSAVSIMGQAPNIPHSLDDVDPCLECHNAAALPSSGPADHNPFGQHQCILCHHRKP